MFRTCSNNLFRSLPAVGIYSNNAWSQKKEDTPVNPIRPLTPSIPSFSPARVSYPPKLSPPSLLSNISYPKDSPLKQSQLIQKIQQIQKECLNPPETKTPLSAAPLIDIPPEKEISDAAPIASDIVGNSIEKRAYATDENPAADPKPSEDGGTAEVACLEKESPLVERGADATLPQESALGWHFSSSPRPSNVAHSEPPPQKIPKGLSAEQNRLIQKIRKGRLDSPTEEIARLIKEGFLSEEEAKKLNKIFTPNKEVQKALYAGAFAIRRVLEPTHYVFLHGQAQQWTLYPDIMKEATKQNMPERDVHQYTVLRYPDLLKKEKNIKFYKNSDTDDHFFGTRQDLLSVDGYFYSTTWSSSCHYFLSTNSNILTEHPANIISEDLHKFYPNIHPAFFRKVIKQLNTLSLKNAPCGNLVVIAVPKPLEGAYYRSHPLGKICDCHPEKEDIQILESLQKNKLSSKTVCKDSSAPQYRLYLPKITPENGCRIYVLSPNKAARKKIKHQIKQMFDSFSSPEKIYDLALAIVTKNGMNLEHVPDPFKKDEKIVRAAVEQNPWAIEFADDSLKEIFRDALKEILPTISRVMTQNFSGPRYQYKFFTKNKEIVHAVVTKDGMALEFADDSLKKDIEIARAAVRQDRRALQFVDPSIQKTLEFEPYFWV